LSGVACVYVCVCVCVCVYVCVLRVNWLRHLRIIDLLSSEIKRL